MNENEKKAFNSGYIKGCRDTIKMFTDMGISLSADVLSLERQLSGEAQQPQETTEEKPAEEAPATVEEAPVEG